MKITIYELLGMVKDGKAPKKIKYKDILYEYDSNVEFYFNNGWSLYREFPKNGNCLNEPVEILEEEKKIPNKWEEPAIKGMKSSNSFEELVPYIETIMRTQNDILDYLKSKGDE